MDFELLKEGSLVMLMGMGFVFFFLVIMIYSMQITEKILVYVNKFCPEEVEEKTSARKKTTVDNDQEVAIAIACAVERGGRC